MIDSIAFLRSPGSDRTTKSQISAAQAAQATQAAEAAQALQAAQAAQAAQGPKLTKRRRSGVIPAPQYRNSGKVEKIGKS